MAGSRSNWGVKETALPKSAVKILLNLAAIGIDALVRGGTLSIGAELRQSGGKGTCEIAVRAAGPRIAFDENIGKALTGALPDGELSSRSAPAYMMYLLAREAGGGVQYALGDDALVLGAVLPQG